jgi:CRISPR/Cas system endoribonuclease Cas6 (RAMP superfamily)
MRRAVPLAIGLAFVAPGAPAAGRVTPAELREAFARRVAREWFVTAVVGAEPAR